MLCSMALHKSYVQHYMANLMLVQCVIAIHAEVWTCQFWSTFYKELTVTMVQVPEGRQCQLKVNIMSNIKVMLTKDTLFADYIL